MGKNLKRQIFDSSKILTLAFEVLYSMREGIYSPERKFKLCLKIKNEVIMTKSLKRVEKRISLENS